MTAALKLERDPIDDVIVLLRHALDIARLVSATGEKGRSQALVVLHSDVAEAADRAFALIPRPPVTRKPDHEWLSLNGGLLHAFPREESGTYERSACGAIRKRRGNWQPLMTRRSCKNCARMVAG